MSQRPAYLIVPRIAFYNDEWYDDYTTVELIADPLELFANRAEADARAQELSRLYLRQTPADGLQLGEWYEQPKDPSLKPLLDSMFNREPLPTDLSDQQIDDLLRLSDLRPFYVLETETTLQEFAQAQIILETTPLHPEFSVAYKAGEDRVNYQGDEAAERLNRVTQLFGRKYATDRTH